MYFIFYGKDKENALNKRIENRSAHVEWLKANPVLLAGPLLDENGDMCGSMVVCEADNLSEAEKLFANDPYANAELFATTEITAWKWVIGNQE